MVLTKGDLDKMEKRITEIEHILSICDDRFDDDVIKNLKKELDEYIIVLEEGIEERQERKFYIVR